MRRREGDRERMEGGGVNDVQTMPDIYVPGEINKTPDGIRNTWGNSYYHSTLSVNAQRSLHLRRLAPLPPNLPTPTPRPPTTYSSTHRRVCFIHTQHHDKFPLTITDLELHSSLHTHNFNRQVPIITQQHSQGWGNFGPQRERERERERERDKQIDRQTDRELKLENFILRGVYFRFSENLFNN